MPLILNKNGGTVYAVLLLKGQERSVQIPVLKHKDDTTKLKGQTNYQIASVAREGVFRVYLINVHTGATWALDYHKKGKANLAFYPFY